MMPFVYPLLAGALWLRDEPAGAVLVGERHACPRCGSTCRVYQASGRGKTSMSGFLLQNDVLQPLLATQRRAGWPQSERATKD
jgi:hypothetical protein